MTPVCARTFGRLPNRASVQTANRAAVDSEQLVSSEIFALLHTNPTFLMQYTREVILITGIYSVLKQNCVNNRIYHIFNTMSCCTEFINNSCVRDLLWKSQQNERCRLSAEMGWIWYARWSFFLKSFNEKAQSARRLMSKHSVRPVSIIDPIRIERLWIKRYRTRCLSCQAWIGAQSSLIS